ncbi:hypothetical protein ACGTI2_20610 [Morganella morganii]|uniref:hypothetical protein n=1 Tax=Morganella morganii TaxID=582 RepID=UPI00386ABB47
MNTTTVFRLPLLFVLAYALILSGSLILVSYPNISAYSPELSLAAYLSKIFASQLIQLTGLFTLTSLFFYHYRITQLNRKTVLGVIGLTIFLYAVNSILGGLKMEWLGYLLGKMQNNDLDFSDIALMMKTTDIFLYLASFILLGIATRLVAHYYIKVSQPAVIPDGNLPDIYALLFSTGMVYLMWMIILFLAALIPVYFPGGLPDPVSEHAYTTAVSLTISCAIIFFVVRSRFPVAGGTLKIRPLVISVLLSTVLSFLAMVAVTAGTIYMVLVTDNFRYFGEAWIWIITAVCVVLTLWISRAVTGVIFRR